MVRSDADWPTARAFYDWAAEQSVDVQHIVYSPAELDGFIKAAAAGWIPGSHHQLQLVLGTYDGSVVSRPADLSEFVTRMEQSTHSFDWMLCAFGAEETACLVEAHRKGGKLRVGFENSLWHADGTVAADNAERVRAITAAMGSST